MLKSSKDVGITEMLVGHLRMSKSEFRRWQMLSVRTEQWAEAVIGNIEHTQPSFSMSRGQGGGGGEIAAFKVGVINHISS